MADMTCDASGDSFVLWYVHTKSATMTRLSCRNIGKQFALYGKHAMIHPFKQTSSPFYLPSSYKGNFHLLKNTLCRRASPGCAFGELFIEWFHKCVHGVIFVVAKVQPLGAHWMYPLLLWCPVFSMITYSLVLAC